MDTFMDKLAQKLNAQEMIRANSAADAEEMGRLKNQIKEYNDCLAKLEKLLEDGAQKLEGAQVNGAELNRLVEESIAKISAMQKDTESIEAMKTVLEELKIALGSTLTDQKTTFGVALEEQKNAMDTALEEQKAVLDAKLADCNENVHKECVKVYRNVQAVIVEENAKQSENVLNSINALKGKLNAVLGVSIAALVMALAGVILQVLNMLNFKFF